MRCTFTGFVPSSNVSATFFSVREPCETTSAGEVPAGGGKQPCESGVGAGAAVGVGLGTTDVGPAGSDATAVAAVGVGPAVDVAAGGREIAGRVSPDATIAPTITIATAPANARKMRVRRRLLGSMITFWPPKLPLLARRPTVPEGPGWWATLDSNQ